MFLPGQQQLLVQPAPLRGDPQGERVPAPGAILHPTGGQQPLPPPPQGAPPCPAPRQQPAQVQQDLLHLPPTTTVKWQLSRRDHVAQQGKDLVCRTPCTLIVTLNTTKTHKHALYVHTSISVFCFIVIFLEYYLNCFLHVSKHFLMIVQCTICTLYYNTD